MSGGSLTGSVSPAAAEAFKALKRRALRFIVFAVGEDFALAVERSAPASAGAAEFLKALPACHARFAVYDHELTTRDGRKASKIYCILWTPAAAVGKDNMLYASQRRALDAFLTGVEDAQCASLAAVGKLVGLGAEDEEEEAWDPDA